jgi:hypothetical protein
VREERGLESCQRARPDSSNFIAGALQTKRYAIFQSEIWTSTLCIKNPTFQYLQHCMREVGCVTCHAWALQQLRSSLKSNRAVLCPFGTTEFDNESRCSFTNAPTQSNVKHEYVTELHSFTCCLRRKYHEGALQRTREPRPCPCSARVRVVRRFRMTEATALHWLLHKRGRRRACS